MTMPRYAPRNGYGDASLIVGFLGMIFAWVPVVGIIAWPLVIAGVIFGVIGVARLGSGEADNVGVAWSGLACSVVGFLFCAFYLALTMIVLS